MLFQYNPQLKLKKTFASINRTPTKPFLKTHLLQLPRYCRGKKQQWLFMYKVEINKSGKLSALVYKKRENPLNSVHITYKRGRC